jgi:hypothetical protein
MRLSTYMHAVLEVSLEVGRALLYTASFTIPYIQIKDFIMPHWVSRHPGWPDWVIVYFRLLFLKILKATFTRR